ncbi:MAG: hypothetical protein JO061_09880 [Acidobacteriaceae bacterium]|nr:hypothetical protein [Acidobacteriaceae bacterium]
MNLTLNIILWVILLAITVGVSLYRRWLENHCDHYIHLHNDSHDAAVVSSQSAVCRKLDLLEKLRIALIVAVVVYALAIAGIASYNAWNTSGMQ